MYGEDNQLNIIKKLFEINWEMLNLEFDSEKNKGRRKEHRKTHNKEEKQLIYNKWKLVMQIGALRARIAFDTLVLVQFHFPMGVASHATTTVTALLGIILVPGYAMWKYFAAR